MLTTHMGVAYARGLSKNGTWSAHDAVIPVMKVGPSLVFPTYPRRVQQASTSTLQATGVPVAV